MNQSDKPSKKKGKPGVRTSVPEAQQPVSQVQSPESHQQPQIPQDLTDVTQQPDILLDLNGDLIQTFVKAHHAFEGALCKMLHFAKVAGEALFGLQGKTGLKGATLFRHVRDQAHVAVSDRSLFLYQRIASRWNELRLVAGDRLDDLTLSKAIKLLQAPKASLPHVPPKPEAQPQKGIAPVVAPKVSTGDTAAGGPNATPQEGQGAEDEPTDRDDEPIEVHAPFDQPKKDRLAAVFAENGPATTSLQMMTSVVIPYLKKAAEVGVSDDDVPFMSNAIHEAMALIEALKQKYAIV